MLIPFSELWTRHGLRNVSEVLHCGANEGQEAEEYNRLGIKRVVWIEAHEPTYQKLVHHIASLKYGSNHLKRFDHVQHDCVTFHNGAIHVCLNACISDKDGEPVTFHVANNGSQSSSILELGTHAEEHPSVKYVEAVQMKTTRLDTLLAGFVPFNPGALFNCDIQGAELLALKGIGDMLKQFSWLYLEINTKPLYVGCSLVEEIDEFLDEYGFKRLQTKLTNHGWGDAIYGRSA